MSDDAPDPPEAFRVPWTWGDAAVLVVWTLFAQVIALVPYLVVGVDPEEGLNVFVYLLAAEALTVVGVYVYLRMRGAWTWHLLGPVRPAWSHVAVGVGVGLAGYVIVVVLLVIVTQVVGELQPPDQLLVERSLEGGLATALGLSLGALVAPVIEELVYRSVLFQALRQRLGLWPAMGVSALVFGLIHGLAPIYMAVLAILGFWLAWAFHHRGSLIVPIVGHATFNLVQLSLGLLLVDRVA